MQNSRLYPIDEKSAHISPLIFENEKDPIITCSSFYFPFPAQFDFENNQACSDFYHTLVLVDFDISFHNTENLLLLGHNHKFSYLKLISLFSEVFINDF